MASYVSELFDSLRHDRMGFDPLNSTLVERRRENMNSLSELLDAFELFVSLSSPDSPTEPRSKSTIENSIEKMKFFEDFVNQSTFCDAQKTAHLYIKA